MNCSFEGLSNLVEHIFPDQLITGAYFIFLNKIANKRNTKSEIINHKYYMLGYNEDREQANWV